VKTDDRDDRDKTEAVDLRDPRPTRHDAAKLQRVSQVILSMRRMCLRWLRLVVARRRA
jgi:hypothetical protein